MNTLLGLLKTANSEQYEIVATLFAVWIDLNLVGQTFNDDDIINEVLTNWHESKLRLNEDRLRAALGWMREKGLTPKGTGKPTIRKTDQ